MLILKFSELYFPNFKIITESRAYYKLFASEVDLNGDPCTI